MPRAFVLFNTRAGHADRDAVVEAMDAATAGSAWTWELFARQKGQGRRAACRAAVDRGAQLLVAAGGDGTVCRVADVGAERGVAVGVLPVGTGNLVARQLGLPMDLAAAARVLFEGDRLALDAMNVGSRRCFSKVSMGLYADVVERASKADKQRQGRLAYARELAAQTVSTPRFPFTLTIDGVTESIRATTVLVANVGAVGLAGLQWATDIDPSDGQLDVCIVRLHTLADVAKLAVGTLMHAAEDPAVFEHRIARHHVVLESPDPDAVVRGDGKALATQRVAIRLEPGAVTVKVPGFHPPGAMLTPLLAT